MESHQENVFSRQSAAAEDVDFVEHIEEGSSRPVFNYGSDMPTVDPSSLPFDSLQGAREMVPYGATSNRVLETEHAKAMLSLMMQRVDILGRADGVRLAFFNGMLLAHVKNSGSVLTPDRAVFYVGDGENRREFNYFADVVDVLGADTRRFFRAYADSTRKVVKAKLAMRGSRSYAVRQDIEHIEQVAHDRGLSRIPELCFDTADACSQLTSYQRDLLAVAKVGILSKGVNMVDKASVIRVAAPGSLAAGSTSGSGDNNISSPIGGPGY